MPIHPSTLKPALTGEAAAILPKLDELVFVLLGSKTAFVPDTDVWPDADKADTATHITAFQTKLKNAPLATELVEALKKLLNIPGGAGGGAGDAIQSAMNAAKDAIKKVIDEITSVNDSLNMGDRVEAFKALNAARTKPDGFGVWNSASDHTGFGYIPAITNLVGAGDASALLGPLQTIADASNAVGAYAILAGYGTAILEKLGDSIAEGLKP